MTKLAVVTHSRGEPHRWAEQSIASVLHWLPDEADFHLIKCQSHEELEKARWNALNLAEYVCFVDDDDLVINNSLHLCMSALDKNPDLAVAFTDEMYIDENGDEIASPHDDNRIPLYEHLSQSAQTLHHLCMIRTSAVNLEAKKITEALGIGGEWLMKAGTALQGGCIHVPIKGYAWRKHSDQHSRSSIWIDRYNDKMHLLQCYLAAQVRQTGKIKRFQSVYN